MVLLLLERLVRSTNGFYRKIFLLSPKDQKSPERLAELFNGDDRGSSSPHSLHFHAWEDFVAKLRFLMFISFWQFDL